MSDPLWYRWNGIAMMPIQPELAEAQFIPDGRYLLEPHHERSYARHRAYFAALKEAWRQLSPSEDYPTEEHLRKRALIATGWRDERTFVAKSHDEALRLAAFVAPFDEHAVIDTRFNVVRVWTAQSQSYKAMGRDKFNRSMDAVLDYVAGLIEVSKEQLLAAGELTA